MGTFTALKQTLCLQNVKKILALSSLSLLITVSMSGVVRADRFEEQINQIREQNNALSGERQQLQAEADSLEATIAGLRAQISSLEAQIRDNEARKADIERQIVETQAEIVRQKDLLGQNIKAMYLEDDMSTFEMLASSNDLSEFVDREQYRITIKDKITATLERIKELEASLQSSKLEVEKILADQRAIQSELAAQRAEQNRLLSMNAAEQASLDGQIRANSSKISQLRSQQAAANARLFRGGVRNVPDTTGYPWPNVPFPNTMVDPWGMYKRQCVSYTAWKVWKSGRHMPYWGGHGNANLWDDNARRAGIPVDGNPRPGDVAVSNSGYYGHVMYVEHVYDDGTIYISQYNAGWTGTYSEARVSVGNLVFIHF